MILNVLSVKNFGTVIAYIYFEGLLQPRNKAGIARTAADCACIKLNRKEKLNGGKNNE